MAGGTLELGGFTRRIWGGGGGVRGVGKIKPHIGSPQGLMPTAVNASRVADLKQGWNSAAFPCKAALRLLMAGR